MIDDGSLSPRKVSWFRVDIDEFPELGTGPAALNGNQLVMGKLGQRKYLDHTIEGSEQVDQEMQIIEKLKPLTGDFMNPIQCSDIEDESNPRRNEVIYFGPKADLALEGSAEVALHLAISEVYHYDDPVDRTWFGWNDEPGCRKGLDSDKNRIGIFNGKGLEPRFYEQGSDQWPDIDQLQKENTHRIVLAEAAWTPRAYNAIALFNLPCLITFVPGLTKEGRDDDWRVQLSTQVNERLRTQDANPHQLFTLAQPYVSAGAADRLAGLYDLSFLLDVKGETEPKVFMMVPAMNELVEFDAVLDSESAFSPERLLKWADFSMDSLAVSAAHSQLGQLQSQELPSLEASGMSEEEYNELVKER